MKNEKGVISLFVLFAMLFLLVFCLSMYLGIRGKMQLQESKNLEVQEIYSKKIDVVSGTEFALTNELMPIYNINQFDVAGTGSYIRINNKIYECGIGRSYILKNNLIVDIDEDLKYKKVGFNDYKLFSSNYYIDKFSYEIYYYKDECYWKCVAYQKFSEEERNLVGNKTYLQNQFSIIGEKDLSKYNEYMIIWNDETGNLSNVDVKKQANQNIFSIDQIKVFNENYKYIDKKTGEFYLFVNIRNDI